MAEVGAPDSIFTQAELAAVALAREHFSAVAKTELLGFAGVIYPDPVASEDFVRSGVQLIDGTRTAPELKEIGDHFRGLVELLGSSATGQAIEVVPQLDAPLVAKGTNAIVDPEQTQPTKESASPEAKHAEKDFKLTRPQGTMIKKVFGDEALKIAAGLNEAQITSIFNELCQTYGELSLPTLRPGSQQQYVSRLRAILVDRLSFDELADREGVSTASLGQVVTIRTPETLLKELSTQQRAEIFGRGVSLAGNSLQNEPEQNHQPSVAVTSEIVGRHPFLEIPDTMDTAQEKLAEVIGVTLKEEYAQLGNIFNPAVHDIYRGETIGRIREDILALVDIVQQDGLLPLELKLTRLEETIVKSLTGDKDKAIHPLSVHSTAGKHARELQNARLNIDKVLRTALAKIYTARSR